jgi:hypothetical protein
MRVPPVHIAVFPGEAENAYELCRSLRFAPGFTVFGASSRKGHGHLVFENYTDDLPAIAEADFIPAFTRFLENNAIRLIFPTHDTAAVFLKEHEREFPARVVCSCLETARICRDKRLLYAMFCDDDFCPDVYPDIASVPIFPVLMKPADGQGGQGCAVIHDREEAGQALARTPDSLLCEYLPGEEYTLDCFTDRHGSLLFVGPRVRNNLRMGLPFASATVPLTPEMRHIAATLNQRLRFRGLWFFQLKADSQGRLKLLEVSTRVATTMGLYRQDGINFAQLAAYDALDMDVSIVKNDLPIVLSRSLRNVYSTNCAYDTVYIDLDDTLIVRGKVNLHVMAFLYQCVNDNKKIILVTRHTGDVREYLALYKIHHTIFDDVFHLTAQEEKNSYIKDKRSIFIDNLFNERAQVKVSLDIPVFGVDALQTLLRMDV